MANDTAPFMDDSIEPRMPLAQLIQRLAGRWQVTGPGIEGEAEYRPVKDDSVLVLHVDFVVAGTKITNIQHIVHDQHSDTLRAHYMDTMGDDSIYTWTLDGQTLRVSLGTGETSDAYFQATLNEDNSEYVGTWHDSAGEDEDADRITYRRIPSHRR